MPRFGQILRSCATLVPFALVALPASAATIFSDISPGYSCCTASGGNWNVGVVPIPNGGAQVPASGFVSPGNFSLSRIDIGLDYNGFGANGAVVSLWTDSSGIPGSELASFSVGPLPDATASGAPPIAITGISGITLAAGQEYFLVAAGSTPQTAAGWNFNDTGTVGDMAFDQGSGFTPASNETLGAFDVIGTAIPAPEPSTVLLFGGALLILGCARRRLLSIR